MAQDSDPVDQGLRGWIGFLAVGIVMAALGLFSVFNPELATLAAGKGIGAILIIAGVAVVVQALKAPKWSGLNWQLMIGAAEIVGGIFIILSPLKGAAVISAIVAIAILGLGVGQIGLALRVRPARGWSVMLGAGVLSGAIGAGMILRFPYDLTESPGVMVGIALLAGGFAYLAMAFGRRAVGTSTGRAAR